MLSQYNITATHTHVRVRTHTQSARMCATKFSWKSNAAWKSTAYDIRLVAWGCGNNRSSSSSGGNSIEISMEGKIQLKFSPPLFREWMDGWPYVEVIIMCFLHESRAAAMKWCDTHFCAQFSLNNMFIDGVSFVSVPLALFSSSFFFFSSSSE